MKKLLFAISLFISITVCAQTNFRVTSLKEAIETANDISKHAKRSFEIRSTTFHVDSTKLCIRYVCQSDTNINLYVWFNKHMKGQNKDLEIPGTLEYKYSTTLGKYLDIFELWKAYVDPNADIEKCLKSYNLKPVNGTKFYFRKVDNEVWEFGMI